MRVMFETTKHTNTRQSLTALGYDFVRRTIWRSDGNNHAFIVSMATWKRINMWSDLQEYYGIDVCRYWTITSCNKQYITQYDATGSTYLGCLHEITLDAADTAALDSGHFLITGLNPDDAMIVWTPSQGNPNKVIPTGVVAPSAWPRLSFKHDLNWPVDPAQPMGKGVVQEMREMQDDLEVMSKSLVDGLNKIDKLQAMLKKRV